MTPKMTPRLIDNAGLHVAILLDGNGRWAAMRGLPRSEGHRAGVIPAPVAVEFVE